MFEEFISVPHTVDEAQMSMVQFSNIYDRMKAYVDSQRYHTSWDTDYSLQSIGMLLTQLSAIGLPENTRYDVRYHENGEYYFDNDFAKETTHYGILINKEASTHFMESSCMGATYLTNAEEFLKQTGNHFLKIMTSPYNHKLYVWTNKTLTPDTLYKLFALEASLNKRQNTLASKFIQCLIEDNAEAARNVIIDFLNSDTIKELEFENFRKCLQNMHQTKINELTNSISDLRNSIKDYEDQIAIYASSIREKNEELAFLRSTDDSEEQKLYWKHLNKIPYIKRFEGYSEGSIRFFYEAPLLYFADYPAEKLINANYTSDFYKNILRAIIGRKYELWTKCAISFDTRYFSIMNVSNRTEGSPDLIQHPHIARYNCFGNHRQAIADSASTGDYIGATEQITQAVLNLNFYDTCVIDTLVSTVHNTWTTQKTWKCVETGEMLTTQQMLERGDYYEEA